MENVLRRVFVKLVKVQWNNHEEREGTWELKSEIKKKYPHLFRNLGMSSLED